MNCMKCNNPLADGAVFCPYCGQKQEAPAVEAPQPTQGKYATGDMPEPEIRFSKNLKEKAPAAPQYAGNQAPLYQPPVQPAAPVFTPPVEEKPVFTPPVAEPPVFAPPVAEPPVFTPPVAEPPVFTPPVAEAPVFTPPVAEPPVFTPPVMEAPMFTPPVEEKPAAKVCSCGAPLDPNSKFCGVCGKPADAPIDLGATFGEYFTNGGKRTVSAPAARKPAARRTAAKKPLDKKVLLIAAIALVAVVGVVIAGILLGWFGGNKPLTTIYDAAEKTLYSGSFNVEFDADIPEVGKISGTADCILDIEEEELTLYAEVSYMGQKVEVGVLDGVAVISMGGYASAVEIDEYLDIFFEELDADMSFEEAMEMGIELGLEMSGAEDMIDGDKLYDCLQDSMNNASWLKKNAGYTTKTEGGVKMHVFAPKLGDLAIAALEAVGPAMEDEDDLEEAIDYMKDSKKEMNKMVDMELAIGIKGGKLVKITGELTAEGQTMEIEASFDNVGSAKVDVDAIEDLLASAE